MADSLLSEIALAGREHLDPAYVATTTEYGTAGASENYSVRRER